MVDTKNLESKKVGNTITFSS